MIQDRREFLKASVAMLIGPFLNIEASTSAEEKLTFDKYKDDWGGYTIIRKGEHQREWRDMGGVDLIDCHGLCATVEAYQLLKNELEMGIAGVIRGFGIPCDIPDEERQRRIQELRKYILDKDELKQLAMFMAVWRGPHDCVHKSKLTC